LEKNGGLGNLSKKKKIQERNYREKKNATFGGGGGYLSVSKERKKVRGGRALKIREAKKMKN